MKASPATIPGPNALVSTPTPHNRPCPNNRPATSCLISLFNSILEISYKVQKSSSLWRLLWIMNMEFHCPVAGMRKWFTIMSIIFSSVFQEAMYLGGHRLWLTVHDVEWPWPLTSSVLVVADVGCRVTLACVLIWGVGAVDVTLTSGHWHPWTPPSSLDQHGIFRSMTTFCPDLSYCLSQNALPEKSPDISAEKQNPRRDLRFKFTIFFF